MIAATLIPSQAEATSLLNLIIAATPTQISSRDVAKASVVHLQWGAGTVTVHHQKAVTAGNTGYELSSSNRQLTITDPAGDRVSLNEIYLSGSAESRARVIAYPITGSGGDFPNPEAWFRGDAITGLADTNPVSSWIDSSGNGNHAVQATGLDQPLYRTNIVNGLPVVRFDGVSDFLESPYSASDDPNTIHQTIFTVFRTNNAGTIQMIVWQGSGSANGWGPEFEIHSNIGNGLLAVNFVGAAVGGQNGEPGSVISFTDTTNFHILTTIFTNLRTIPIVSVSLDGGAFVTTSSNGGDEIQGWIGSTRIGRPGVATRFFTGDIAEVLIFDSDMTEETDRVISYLKMKYNIP